MAQCVSGLNYAMLQYSRSRHQKRGCKRPCNGSGFGSAKDCGACCDPKPRQLDFIRARTPMHEQVHFKMHKLRSALRPKECLSICSCLQPKALGYKADVRLDPAARGQCSLCATFWKRFSVSWTPPLNMANPKAWMATKIAAPFLS